MCYGGIALPSDLGIIFSNIEKESESVPTPDCEDSSSCFKHLSTGMISYFIYFLKKNTLIISSLYAH